MKFLLPIQSYTDIITNSSSELFLMSKESKTLDFLEDLHKKGYDEELNNCSGDGGELTIISVYDDFLQDYKDGGIIDYSKEMYYDKNLERWASEGMMTCDNSTEDEAFKYYCQLEYDDLNIKYDLDEIKTWSIIHVDNNARFTISKIKELGGIDIS